MRREGGYTLVEAGLAIGVSSLLILLTLGLSSMVSRRRFQDTLSTGQAFLQTQYNEVRSGINSRLGGAGSNLFGCGSSAAGNSASCYMVGRLLSFSNSGGNGIIKSSYIIAKVSGNWPDTEKTGMENVRATTLYAVTNDSSDAGLDPSTKVLGGNQFKNAWSVIGSSASSRSVESTNMALIRSPLDGSLMIASNVQIISDSGSGQVRIVLRDNATSSTNMSPDDKIALGVENGGLGQQGGLICMAGGENAAGISNNNNVNLGDLAAHAGNVSSACSNWE